MTRTCSKGMFNDFFGQWNAHVHCWCNTNKRIRKNQQLGVVSAFPVQRHFMCVMWTKRFKMEQNKDVWSVAQRLTSRGRASSYFKKTTTSESTYTCAWLSAMYAQFHSFHLRNVGNIPVPYSKCHELRQIQCGMWSELMQTQTNLAENAHTDSWNHEQIKLKNHFK